jgi:hypothetical protein
MFGRAVGSYKKVKASREALAKELQVTLGTDSSYTFPFEFLPSTYLPLVRSCRSQSGLVPTADGGAQGLLGAMCTAGSAGHPVRGNRQEL